MPTIRAGVIDVWAASENFRIIPSPSADHLRSEPAVDARPTCQGFPQIRESRDPGGGAQEDDRTGGYRNCAEEILTYTTRRGLRTKLIFLNDGPGLLLGTMWDDYASLEESWPRRIRVVTLRMVPERVTPEWLRS